MSKKRIILFKSIICYCLLLLQTSCAPKKNLERIIVASAGKIESLDPAQANTLRALQLLSALGDTLYIVDKEGDLKPHLAEGLPLISSDGLVLDIKLKKGIYFHDGTPFNAEAMAFSLRRFINIGTLNYLINKKIERIETPKDYLIRIRLNKPSNSFLKLLTSVNLTPVSPTAYSNHKDEFLNKNFIGTGPYKLRSFGNQHQKIDIYNNYWGDKPLNKGIDYINFNSSSTLYASIRTGEVDLLMSNSINDIQHLALTKLSQKGLLNEGEGNPTEIGFITFKSNNEPFNKVNIRKAISYSLNRDLISEKVSFGIRKPLKAIIPNQFRKDNSYPWPNYNPEITRNILKEEGFCGSQKLELPLTFRSNVPADKLLALTWKEQLKRDLPECINLILNGVESTTVYKQLGDGAFEAVILDWTGAYPDPEAYLSPLISCSEIIDNTCKKGESVFSGSFWANKVSQKYLEDSELLSGDSRLKLLFLAEDITAKHSAYLPVWLVKPKAWSQKDISRPIFNGNGFLELDKLKRK